MKKIYAFLAGVTLAMGVSAATIEKAPRVSMENATVVGRIENNFAPKKVADKSKAVLSRADESETAPSITGDYMIFCDIFNGSDLSTRMAPSNNLVPTENEGEYLFETFIFSNISRKGKLQYDPKFWLNEKGDTIGEWVLSIAVGDSISEPLFYEDLSEYASYGFTDNEPIYLYFVGWNDSRGRFDYYSFDACEFVVRDGQLVFPYIDGFGLAMASRFIPGAGGVTFGTGYLNLITALPNAHGTAIDSYRGDDGNIVEEEFTFPMYTEAFEEEGYKCLCVKGLCGNPGEQYFILSQEEKLAEAIEDYPLMIYNNKELYMTQDLETDVVLMEITPETAGNTVLSSEFIGMMDFNTKTLYGAYYDVVVTLDYNVWTGEETGIKSAVADDSNAPAVYYNLQGVQVANPTAGQLYIVKQGNKVTKQIIK